MKHFIFVLFLVCSGILFGQSIEKKWHFNAIEKKNTSLIPINPASDFFHLENNQFHYELAAKNKLVAKGDYILQNDLLVFYYNKPHDTIRRYRITEHTDSTLVITENNISYKFKQAKQQLAKNSAENNSEQARLIPSQGFSFKSLWRGLIGMIVILGIAFVLSSDRKKISWRLVIVGISLQVLIAISIQYIPAVEWFFKQVSKGFVAILDFTRAGSEFLLGGLMDVSSYGFIFLFQILPTVIFFSALTSLFFYLGILQKIVQALAWVMKKSLRISGSESLAVAGNIFLGQTEAPLMIKAYLDKMNKSEIFLIMVGGMSTLAGGVLAAYIDLLGDGDYGARLIFAKQLLMASIMAAPGAIVIAKILVPQTEGIKNMTKISSEKIGSNLLDSIAIGTTEGLKLAANVGAMLLVFVALIAMINGILNIVGDATNLNTMIAAATDGAYKSLSLEYLLGSIFAPLAYADRKSVV